MKIAMCHFRYGMPDGVSLEMEKWGRALEGLGHEVTVIAGEDPTGTARIIPELSIPWAEGIRSRAFGDRPGRDPGSLGGEIEREADGIAKRLAGHLREVGIDLLIVENLWSLPLNIPASLGVLRAVVELGLPVIAYHHDFWWEREIYRSACPWVAEILEEHFPPAYRHAAHVVINSLAQRELVRRRGIPAKVIPNVIDFDEPWGPDDFNADLRERLGLSPQDIVFLQATRIVPRKGIEIALELVHRFQEEVLPRVRIPGKGDRAVVSLPNLVEDEGYREKLERRARSLGVEVLFCSGWFGMRRLMRDGGKVYSLWDAYTVADFVTYPSLQEGWGNQFLEAVKAKLPLAVFEYPVFKADIAPYGFRYVSLGDSFERGEEGLVEVPERRLRQAADEVAEVLADPRLHREIVEHNYAIGAEHFSLRRLRHDLEGLLGALV